MGGFVIRLSLAILNWDHKTGRHKGTTQDIGVENWPYQISQAKMIGPEKPPVVPV